MAHCLDTISVGIENEGTIVRGMVLRSWAGGTITVTASGNCCFVEGVNCRPIWTRKRNMNWTVGLTAFDPKIGLSVASESPA